eukprot:354727-Chlamydomonas_euryale.AAC.2
MLGCQHSLCSCHPAIPIHSPSPPSPSISKQANTCAHTCNLHFSGDQACQPNRATCTLVVDVTWRMWLAGAIKATNRLHFQSNNTNMP